MSDDNSDDNVSDEEVPARGLRADIYRSTYRCTLNILDRVQRVTLVGRFEGARIAPVTEPHEGAPAIVLGETTPGHIVARPMAAGDRWLMFGGSFVYSGDSRWPAGRPIPLHDRYEGDDWDFAAGKPKAVVPIRMLAATCGPTVIDDELSAMTDGSYRVAAFEVYDHPGAVHAADEVTARRHGVDPGTTLGAWVLGRPDQVEAYLAEQGWKHYQLLYTKGRDPETN
ncbi:hypothetical protein BJF78_34665 [Pseudonocardia sp. CNS-139]|nr:hypothetical protein BJF78_34665 [Pseudonocardia sp. CNS-139]